METTEIAVESNGGSSNSVEESSGIDWTAYAEAYDSIPDLFPTYRENMEILRKSLLSRGLTENLAVCDIGAGTGNFISSMSEYLRDSSFCHLDSNHSMNRIARQKYADLNLSVDMVEEQVQRVDFAAGSFDLIICINALYAMQPRSLVLKKMHKWLKDDGLLFIIDFGRKQKVTDWSWYFLKSVLTRDVKLSSIGKAIKKAPALFAHGIKGTKGQTKGNYWTHSTAEFGEAISLNGFDIEELDDCYLGYADLVVCHKSATHVTTKL